MTDEDDNIWEGWKEESQKRRRKHRSKAPEILDQHGITWNAFTDAHLVVMGPLDDFDFWPGTGKYIGRKSGKVGRGIFNLIAEVKK